MELQNATCQKKPYKLFEHPLSQFNNVVIPHRLDMLRKYTANTVKAIQHGDLEGAVKEQSTAKNLIQNIRRDISDIEALRTQVQVQHLPQFDKAIEVSCSKANQAINEYIRVGEITLSHRLSSNCEEESLFPSNSIPAPQLMVDKQSLLDKNEETYVKAWEKLREDIQDMQCVFTDLHKMVQDQGEVIDNIEENTASAVECVHQGNKDLKTALKYSKSLSLAGAAIGTVVGGPIGLVIGLKTAGCFALGGGILGFIGAKALGKNSRSDDTSVPDKKEQSSSKEHQS